MISELSIRNFAIIDDISITFNSGLTVLTGETGAGKSIIIDALELLTGSRGSVDYVRHGQDKAEISGLFLIEKAQQQLYQLCDEYGIEVEDDTIILDRTITNYGKSICRINGKMVTLTILRQIGQLLVNIHSQHDTIHLMDRKTHITLLDSYNDKEIKSIKHAYHEVFNKYQILQQKYKQLNKNEQQMAHRFDLLQFQLVELEQADLQNEEDIKLEEERSQLQNYEKIYRSLQQAYYALIGDQKGLELINVAQLALHDGKEYNSFIEEISSEVSNIYYNLEDITLNMRHYIDQLYFDEARLNEIEARLNEINRLKKKYGSTIEEMIQYLQQVKKEIDEIQHKDSHLENIKKEIQEVQTEALTIAKKLHQARKKTATLLEKDIQKELSDLYLENATIRVSFHMNEHELHENGIDQVTFMLSTNLGEPLKELDKIASGGELSRIMLALKKIFAKHDQISTVVLDEIDTGVSGRVAQSIAEKMYQISTTTQVLCITHLPQVAAMADHHLLIEKKENNSRTTTSIHSLNKEEKINELGKMITGTKLTETAIEHSQELLDFTQSIKKAMKS